MAKIVRSRIVHEGWSSFRLLDVQLDDGSIVSREVEDHGDGVMVLPYDPERRTALMVRQERAPVLLRDQAPFWEAPAGLIDEGETPEACGRREVLEETGVRVQTMEPLGRCWATPGSSTEQSWLFLATYSAADKVAPGGGADAHEHVEISEVPLAELARAADANEIEDLKLLALVLSLLRRRPDLFG